MSILPNDLNWNHLRALTVIGGSVRLGGVNVEAGRSVAIPAGLGAAAATLDHAHAVVSAAPVT